MRIPRTLATACTVLTAGAPALCGSAAGSDDLSAARVILERYRDLMLRRRPPNAKTVRGLVSRLGKDGRWPDINYADKTRSRWRASDHLARLGTIARALAHPKGPARDDRSTEAAALRALDHWLEKRYKNPNWWHNRIGVPRQVRDILVLLEPRLSRGRMAKALEVVKQFGSVGMTGANLIWVADLAMCYAAWKGDGKLLAQAAGRIAGEIKMGAREGIQPDYSFYQHGARLQSFHYGGAFVGDVTRLAWQLRGTPWAVPTDKIVMLADCILEGTDWMRRGRHTVPGTMDRAVSRPNALGGKSLAWCLNLLRDLAPPRQAKIDAVLAREEGKAPPLVGHRHFPYGDLTVFHRPAFSFFVKVISSRTYPTEKCNSENLKGDLLHSGDHYVIRDGQEYYNMMPVWDWDLLPGVTWSPQAGKRVARSPFVGGVSDGRGGLTAMDYRFGGGKDKRKRPRPELRARKAWLCHGDLVVCLIGDLTTSGISAPVRTALDQCRLRGAVTVGDGRGRRTISGGGPHELTDVRWLHHHDVAYLMLDPSQLTLEAGPVSGSWRSINRGLPEGRASDRVFMPVLEHGTGAKNLSTGYVIAPGIAAEQAARLASRLPFDLLSNDARCQAVRFADGTLMAAFYEPGILKADGRAVATVDKPCLLMAKRAAAWVANPAFKKDKVNVALADGRRLSLEMPAGGATAKVSIAPRPGTRSRSGRPPPGAPRDPLGTSARGADANGLLRVGRQAEQRGQRDAAVSFYARIVRDYPGTSAAKEAAARLRELNERQN